MSLLYMIRNGSDKMILEVNLEIKGGKLPYILGHFMVHVICSMG